MSNTTLPSISIRSTLSSVTSYPRRGQTGQIAADSPAVSTPPKAEPAPAEKEAPAAAPRPAPADSFRNIRLQFKIDPKTNDVTVLMVDVNARKVVRSIPAEELQRLDQGELVQMLA